MPLLRTLLPIALLAGLVLGFSPSSTPAQQPQDAPPPPPNGSEVLARGPVHEAFAATYEQPTASSVVPKMPPAPVEELPPDQKPEGDNVQWIPGYWQWDDERTDFIWVSGFWRAPPPNRAWVPGNWHAVTGGAQWTSGFWQDTTPPQANQPINTEVQYLPPPPESIDVGPNVPAPVATDIYVPGSWMWRGRYLWRPGFWVNYRPNWLWTPAHYHWTPVGYLFSEGYWDYPLETRGVLFAPAYFPQNVYAQPGFIYTPAYVVSVPCMIGALFTRNGCGNYFFGDYFDARYRTNGFRPWCNTALEPIGGRRYGYDPLWSHYSIENRGNANWNKGITNLYTGRFRGDVPRPARTLDLQNTNIQKVTNVRNVSNITNTMTVVNRNVTVNNTNITNVAMLAPLRVVHQLQPETKIQAVTPEVRRQEQAHAGQLRQVSVERNKQEAGLIARGNLPTKPNDAPVSMKLNVPPIAAARSQPIARNAPPVAPVHVAAPNAVTPHPGNPGGHILDPRVEYPGAAKVEPKRPTAPTAGKEEPPHAIAPTTPKVERPTEPAPRLPAPVVPRAERPIPPPVVPHVPVATPPQQHFAPNPREVGIPPHPSAPVAQPPHPTAPVAQPHPQPVAPPHPQPVAPPHPQPVAPPHPQPVAPAKPGPVHPGKP